MFIYQGEKAIKITFLWNLKMNRFVFLPQILAWLHRPVPRGPPPVPAPPVFPEIKLESNLSDVDPQST